MWAADDDEWDPGFIEACVAGIEDCGSAMSHIRTVNRATGVVTEEPMPQLSASQTRHQNALLFIRNLTPGLFYGIHRRQLMADFGSGTMFDFYD